MFDKAMALALNYLSYKGRTEKEMKVYLLRKGYTEEIVATVIEKLKDYNYVDDKEYATNFHKSQLLNKGYGPLRIQYKLLQKGISKEEYRQIELQENFNYFAIALKQGEKKLKGKKDIDSLRKVYGYLLRRGFSQEVVNKVIATFKEEEF